MSASQLKFAAALASLLIASPASAQVNSGSNGSDGAFNPTANIVIDMADHPDGIYHYTSVNIPGGVTVSFKPNAGNKPVVWLVQGDCVINGEIGLNGQSGTTSPGIGGAGGYRGGYPGGTETPAGNGVGPGGGSGGPENLSGGNASYGTVGVVGYGQNYPQGEAGSTYGSPFILPLIGGSGGGGIQWYKGSAAGGGGAGAILIATSGTLQMDGAINARGGDGGLGTIYYDAPGGGGGSGGAIRLVGSRIRGTGTITVLGGRAPWHRGTWCGCTWYDNAGAGRVRLDGLENTFTGLVSGTVSRGFQPIIIPAPNQGVQLNIQSVAGAAISANPSGVLVNPDVIIPAQQANPIPIIVKCNNVPLNSEITVVVQPANGSPVQAVGLNNAGSLATSTATVSLNMPRGGGIIYAKAVVNVTGLSMNGAKREKDSIASTGWTADGEAFKSIEITAALGGAQKVAYITTSGKRYEIN